jgi:hypothetical protein
MAQVAHDEHGLRRVIDEDRDVVERVIDACRRLVEF